MQPPDSMSSWGAFLLHRRPLLWRVSAAPVLLLSLCNCSGGVLDPQGPIGAANAKILLNALGIMLVIVVPTITAILIFAWWFRAANTRARYRPDFVYSGAIEMVVWGIPILDHSVSWRRDLDRGARSRPLQADCLAGQTDRGA